MVFGIAAIGGSFIKISFAGISFTYITIAFLFLSYINYFALNKGIIQLNKRSKALMLFELYALIMVFLSILHLTEKFISQDLFTNTSFIPRQAYYIAVIPAIILMREEIYTKRLFQFLDKNSWVIFWTIYIIHILYNKKIAISVPTVLILAFLSLYKDGNRWTKGSLIRFIIIAFTPIAVGGELTNLIIRCIYSFLFLYRKNLIKSVKLLKYVFICMLACIFFLPLFTPLFELIFDANSFWRLSYWQDELMQLFKSKMIGVGYGTSYATENFVGGLNVIGGPFGATAEYSTLDKLFVTGPHCSYVAIAFRTGLIGINLFLYFIFSVINSIEINANRTPIYTIFLLFSSIILIGVNVGLESPYYLIMFVFSLGLSYYNICRLREDKNEE